MTVGGVVLYKVCKTEPRITTHELKATFDGALNPEHIKIQDFEVGGLDDVVKYGNGSTELWLDRVGIGDIGKLGEEIESKIPDIPENAHIWMLMNITE